MPHFDAERPFAEAEAEPPAANIFAGTPELGFEASEEPDESEEPEPVPADDESLFDNEEKPAVVVTEFVSVKAAEVEQSYIEAEPDPEPIESEEGPAIPDLEASGFTPIPKKRPPGVAPWYPKTGNSEPTITPASEPEPGQPKLKLGVKQPGSDSELSLDSTPRGRFEGENPNVFEGEDLDLPPFLRKKK